MSKGLPAALWTAGRLLPVQKNKIVVTNFYGRGYGDNLKPIVAELLHRGGGLDIVWLTADEGAAKSLPAGVRAVPYTPWNRIRELSTAKIWLDNGKMFGDEGEGFARINIACPRATLEEALERLEKAVSAKRP